MNTFVQGLLAYRHRISAQLYFGLGGAVALTFAASLVGWFSFNQVGDAQTRVNERNVPELAAAFDLAQYNQALVAAADTLTAATTAEEAERISDKIATADQSFKERLAILESSGGESEELKQINKYSTALLDNTAGLKGSIWHGFSLQEKHNERQAELEKITQALDNAIIPAIDRQFFYIQTGYKELDQPPATRSEHTSSVEQAQYRYLTELQSNAKIATQLLAGASIVSDRSLIEPFRERFESSANNIKNNLAHLQGTPLHDELEPHFNRLMELGLEPGNGFDLRATQLDLKERQQTLLANNYNLAAGQAEAVESLVGNAEAGAQDATKASERAILTGRYLLLAISLFSVSGAVLIAWLFVGRVLLRRLGLIASWMRSLAAGDLDTKVEISGRDEVAEMAAALEIFRHNAQEALRLNLVEEMAKELEGKNSELEGINQQLDSQNQELETAMANLTEAQDRIVAQEKLASLGQLTAGVAHEIRNPLNFIKNFSESSEELLDEIREALEQEKAVQMDDGTRELTRDIFSDLADNLERIQTHGERANRIVQDMLMMGRDSVVRQMSNINNLLEEHARLAYHSARAADSEFQLDLQYDLGKMEDVEVNPQDIGRVFLNMVSNACYATDEKRRDIARSPDTDGYKPELLITTRKVDDHIEVRIRDNGNGMPQEIIDQIFNPFFTTKPTGQGTGLGLSICNDVVREHGGAITVSSEPGEFTEMAITLPIQSQQTEGETA